MKTRTKVMVLGLVMAMVFCYAGIVGAGSSSDTGAGASAAVNLDFQIVIPSFIYFRVGTVGGTVDTIVFSPSADEVATAAQDIAGTGGDQSGGTVTAILISNGGAVTLEANGNGGLSDGSNTIDFSTIGTSTSNPSFQPPVLSNGTNTTSPSSGPITNLSSTWTYDFDMPASVPAVGTYLGQVTYTASIP